MQSPLRALLLRFNCDVTQNGLKNIMKEVPFAFCASLGTSHTTYPSVPSDAQPQFVSMDVRHGIYKNVDHAMLQPIDEELIEAMRDAESLFMYMLVRHEFARTIPYLKRKQLYLKHLRFWNDFLDRHDINILLSSTLPHEMPDHIIYALCKYKKIPTIFAHATPIRDTFFLQTDIEESSADLRDRFEEICKENTHDEMLSDQLELYYKTQTQLEGQLSVIYPIKPKTIWQKFFSNILGAPNALLHWMPTLLSTKDWIRRIQKLRSARLQRDLCVFYDKHAVKPDFEKDYIYYPLQYQPECSTCPMAGAFVDQEVSLHLLSRTIPKDVLIYVKEHPRQRKEGTAARTIEFYKELLSMPNVRLIAHEASTFHLREHCRAVATATGTAGFEAIFREKPAIIFGHAFYQYAPGIHSIRTVDDCKKAVHAIFNEEKKPTLPEVRKFLKAIDDTRMHLAIGGWYIDISNRTVKESTNVFTFALKKALLSL